MEKSNKTTLILPTCFVGGIGGFLGSFIFLPIMTVIPGTFFMVLAGMSTGMGQMVTQNFAGWVIHALVNSLWGGLFGLLFGQRKGNFSLFAIPWSLLLALLVILANPLVGLPVTGQLVLIEGGAYLLFGLILGLSLQFSKGWFQKGAE